MTIPEKRRDGSTEKKGKSFFVRFDAPEAASVFFGGSGGCRCPGREKVAEISLEGGSDRAPSGSFPGLLGSDPRPFEGVTLRKVRRSVPLSAPGLERALATRLYP